MFEKIDVYILSKVYKHIVCWHHQWTNKHICSTFFNECAY